MRPGYQALMRRGQIVHYGPLGDPIEDVEFDTMLLHPSDVGRLNGKLLAPRQDGGPGYWMHETSGRLRPAVEAYLSGGAMTPEHVAAMRAYLRQWIAAPAWIGPDVTELRAAIDGLTDRAAIERWLDAAIESGIDPL